MPDQARSHMVLVYAESGSFAGRSVFGGARSVGLTGHSVSNYGGSIAKVTRAISDQGQRHPATAEKLSRYIQGYLILCCSTLRK